MTAVLFTPAYEQLLLTLLQTPTTSPMETGQPSSIAAAQQMYAAAATAIGFEVIAHAPPQADLTQSWVPVSVREMAEQMGSLFLESQPNMVLRLGPARDRKQTLMFNFHMDTVAGEVPVGYADGRFTGRGAVDMQGPGVALLAGIHGALQECPRLADDLTLLIQCVSGEEGGAMGVYGTKALVDQGFVGQLNIIAEPSEGYFFDHATTSMTARIAVTGLGSTDDEPQAGHNATLLLGYIAQYLGRHLAPRIAEHGGKMCLAGLHTGTMHNRVYGSGTLMLNFAYHSLEQGLAMRDDVERVFAQACAQFQADFSAISLAQKTVEALPEICRLTWIKQGLPVLANRSQPLEALLRRVGLTRSPEERAAHTFTCDALWVQGDDMYTIVYGPGSLGENGAHTEAEYIMWADLEAYAHAIAAVIQGFRDEVCAGPA